MCNVSNALLPNPVAEINVNKSSLDLSMLRSHSVCVCVCVCVSETEFIHCDMCVTSVCSPPAGWLCRPDSTGRHSSTLVCVFIVTPWSKVTTPSLQMIFYPSWVQQTTSPSLTRATAGRWILLSLHISLLDLIALFPLHRRNNQQPYSCVFNLPPVSVMEERQRLSCNSPVKTYLWHYWIIKATAPLDKYKEQNNAKNGCSVTFSQETRFKSQWNQISVQFS